MAGLHVEYVKMDKDGSISVDSFKAKVILTASFCFRNGTKVGVNMTFNLQG